MQGGTVVTGAGLVSAGGDTPHALHAALLAGTPLVKLHEESGIPLVAIEDFDPKRYLDRKGLKDLSRTSQLACSAASANARELASVAPEEIGVAFGTAWGSLTTVVEFERQAFTEGARFVDPLLFTETVTNVPAGQVSIFFRWSAFNATLAAGSASGLASVRRAAELLQEGRGAVAVAGGGDELNLGMLRALRTRGALASGTASLPFAAQRSGPQPGEGACFLTLESEEHAVRRGAVPAARIVASAARFVAPRSVAPRNPREALAGLIRDLLVRSKLRPEELDLIVVSANGSAGDADEAGAILDVFGSGSGAPSLVAPKAILGETWGASGPLAVVIASEIMRSSSVPGMPRGFRPGPGFEDLGLPLATLCREVRHTLVLDRSDSGHQHGIVLSAPGTPS